MFIIDGHNLIPKVPGLSLRDIDDEEKLIDLLKEYARLKRKEIIVFFDGAPPGQAGERVYGLLRAHFVPAGRTADDAILQYLQSIGKTARAATVVSSDRQVRANAHGLHARVMSSEDFAQQLSNMQAWLAARPPDTPGRSQKPPKAEPTPDVSQWIDLFGLDPASAEKPIELSKRPPRKSQPGRQKPAQSPEDKTAQKKKHRPYHGFPKKS